LFPNIPPGRVIVMDNAPSQSRLEENISSTSTRKADITKEQNSNFARSKDKKSTYEKKLHF
jgi:hypothetical protein